jgi:hypothetical protein
MGLLDPQFLNMYLRKVALWTSVRVRLDTYGRKCDIERIKSNILPARRYAVAATNVGYLERRVKCPQRVWICGP